MNKSKIFKNVLCVTAALSILLYGTPVKEFKVFAEKYAESTVQWNVEVSDEVLREAEISTVCETNDDIISEEFETDVNNTYPIDDAYKKIPDETDELIEAYSVTAEGVEGDFSYEVVDDSYVKITKYNGSDENVTVPDIIAGYNVTAIGPRAFEDCSLLVRIDLPGTITEIESSAFNGCSALTDPIFNNGLTTIGSDAFAGCYSIKNANLPDSVTSIGVHAFYGCSNLSYFKYPKGLEEVYHHGGIGGGDGIFVNCPKLTSIEIPEGVTVIPDGAFSKTEALVEVKFPSTLTEIESSAFNGCSALTDPIFNNGLTTIGSDAFAGCYSIKNANLPDSVTSIGVHAFYGCSNLSYFKYPKGLEEVYHHGGIGGGDGIFVNCPKLTSIEIPEGVTTIPAGAFRGTESLTAVIFPDTLTSIGSRAFDVCANLANVQFNDKLTYIGAYAFALCTSLTRADLPDTITEIDRGAFKDCTNLTNVCFNDKLTSIGSEVFKNCSSLTIYCPNNSATAVYAIDNDIPVVFILGERVKTDDTVLNYSNSKYATNFSSVNSSGRLSMICEYAFDDEKFGSVYNPKIKIKIPEGYEFLDGTLYLNGVYSNNFTCDDKYLYIPVNNKSGKITFSFKQATASKAVTYALMTYGSKSDIIGIVNEEIPSIAIYADSAINSPEVSVTGIAPINSDIDIFVNGSKAGTAKSNKAGFYSTKISIPSPENGRKYTLTARSISDNSLSADTIVQYAQDNPVLKGLTMEYNGKKYDLMNSRNINITFRLESFHGATPFHFEAVFENPQNVTEAYITSTRNSSTKYLKAVWSDENQAFVADGYFDPENHDYVPGKLSVAYQKPWENHFEKNKTLFEVQQEISKKLDNDIAQYVTCNVESTEEIITIDPESSPEAISYYAKNAKSIVKPIKTTVKTDVFSVYVNEAEFDLGYDTIKLTLKTISKPKGTEGFDWFGYLSAADDIHSYVFDTTSEKYVMNLNYADPKTYFVLVDDVAGNDIIELALQCLNDGKETLLSSKGVSVIGKISGYISDMYDINEDFDTLIDNINKTVPLEFRQEALNKATEIEVCRTIFETSMFVAKTAAVFAGPYAIPLTFLLGLEENIGNYLFDKYAAGILNADPSGIFNWYIDPSGYVYEAVTSNRLENVKTTAYWIPYDENDSSFWDAPKKEKSVLWASLEYSQENPLITDRDGNYAWDVPEGWWRVKFELEGYETRYSEWLPVPPPQTNVNIGLVSAAAPVVKTAEKVENGLVILFDKYIIPATVNGVTVYDTKGNKMNYALDYSKEETSAEGTVYAKKFTLIISGGADNVGKIIVPDTVKSYSGTGAEEYVKSFADFILGDVNSDGRVNDRDSIQLDRYLAEWGNEINISAADFNGDGKVNDRDSISLARTLAGWYE